MPTSADTLLRRVKQAPDEPAPPPRYVGVDDGALRKGQQYGTILIDLERGRVIAMLPGRDGEALKAWLKDHPQVEVITRDRWAAYAEAATAGAPQAQQVADRWHLLKNRREAVERLPERRETAVHEALREPVPTAESAAAAKLFVTNPSTATSATEPVTETTLAAPAAEPVAAPTPAAIGPPESQPSPSPRQRARPARQQRRAERPQRVREPRGRGRSLRQIARATGLSVKSVIRYLRQERCPDWNPGRPRPTRLDAFAPFIGRWIEEGGPNAAALHRELAGRGCGAS
jgi:hypothetical protein